MDIFITEWLSFALRWAHLILGIGWIGASFYFIWLDLSLRKRPGLPDGVQGENWSVHGGGFYHAQKYMVAPDNLPRELHWFKYEAYYTWISGFLLMAVMYYWGAESYLIDPDVRELEPWQAIVTSLVVLASGWIFYDLVCRSPIGQRTGILAILVFGMVLLSAFVLTQLFSARAAFLHVGAIIGTIMSANVFFIIIPNQKKTIAAMMAGNDPEPKWGSQAKQRSTHNNYLTLPVLVMMVAAHYPMLFGTAHSWLVVALILIIGGLVRHFYNTYDIGRRGGAIAWQLPLALLAFIVLVLYVSYDPKSNDEDAALPRPSDEEIQELVLGHCVMCHAAEPGHPDFRHAPGGIKLEKLRDIKRHASRVHQQVMNKTMPLANITGMSAEERDLIDRWVRSL